jgi:hypothetical protein
VQNCIFLKTEKIILFLPRWQHRAGKQPDFIGGLAERAEHRGLWDKWHPNGCTGKQRLSWFVDPYEPGTVEVSVELIEPGV